jgi:hypothetical protein
VPATSNHRPLRVNRTGLEQCEGFSDHVRGSTLVPDSDKILFLNFTSLERAKAGALRALPVHTHPTRSPRQPFLTVERGLWIEALHHDINGIVFWGTNQWQVSPGASQKCVVLRLFPSAEGACGRKGPSRSDGLGDHTFLLPWLIRQRSTSTIPPSLILPASPLCVVR